MVFITPPARWNTNRTLPFKQSRTEHDVGTTTTVSRAPQRPGFEYQMSAATTKCRPSPIGLGTRVACHSLQMVRMTYPRRARRTQPLNHPPDQCHLGAPFTLTSLVMDRTRTSQACQTTHSQHNPGSHHHQLSRVGGSTGDQQSNGMSNRETRCSSVN